MEPSFKQNLSYEDKIIYLNSLLYVMAPKTTSRCEYIRKQAKDIGFPAKELSKIKKNLKPETASLELLKVRDLKTRRYIIREMIMLAINDHELSDAEMCDIYKIGAAVGIKEEKINDFFLWAAQGIEWQIEGISLVEEDL
ncbi:MAG: hypothetical protein E7012_04460 [Alphaproteobacteria bacterium]|nr:hypothetical protein [Alphaproteobacteria bacterium]